MKYQSKVIAFCLIGCIASLLLAENLSAQNRGARQKSEADGNFYRVIVENNLFRPLGWRKPKEGSRYALIATKIQPKGKIKEAFVIENRSNKYYTVSVGEKVGEATVEKIEDNQISLNIAGKVTTLKADAGPFLSKSGGGRPSKPAQASSSQPKDSEKKPEQTRQNNRPDPNNIRDRFRNASPDERKKLIEEFRRNRGRGRGAQRRNRR